MPTARSSGPVRTFTFRPESRCDTRQLPIVPACSCSSFTARSTSRSWTTEYERRARHGRHARLRPRRHRARRARVPSTVGRRRPRHDAAHQRPLLQPRRVPPRGRAHAVGRIPEGSLLRALAPRGRDAAAREQRDHHNRADRRPRDAYRAGSDARQRTTTGARTALSTRRSGHDAQRPPARAHAPAEIRARQARRDPQGLRTVPPPRRQRPRRSPCLAALLRRRVRGARALGRRRRPRRSRMHRSVGELPRAGGETMSHDHDHDHDHDHHPEAPSPVEARALALESLLVEKGLLTSEEVDRIVSMYEHDIGPMLGARVVARAWVDEAYKQRLLEDGPAAVKELGISYPAGTQLVVVENQQDVHNVIVCTLCSCYPWPVLGLPPSWYKSPPYRSRMVREPRTVLEEFNLTLPDEVAVNVWDSSSDVRYMVLPQRPQGTEGWTEEQLAGIVTRDCMIGVARPGIPAESAAR